MATRSERFHADEQQHASKTAKKRQAEHSLKKGRIKRALHAHENVHAAHKATVALEPRPATGRPSRKSSRKSANRAKFDANVELRGERAKVTPSSRYRGRK
jgi:hypothetical protein